MNNTAVNIPRACLYLTLGILLAIFVPVATKCLLTCDATRALQPELTPTETRLFVIGMFLCRDSDSVIANGGVESLAAIRRLRSLHGHAADAELDDHVFNRDEWGKHFYWTITGSTKESVGIRVLSGGANGRSEDGGGDDVSLDVVLSYDRPPYVTLRSPLYLREWHDLPANGDTREVTNSK